MGSNKPTSQQLRREAEELRKTAVALVKEAARLIQESAEVVIRISERKKGKRPQRKE